MVLSIKDREYLGVCIKFICMFLFLYTACSKLVDHDRFLQGLSRVHIINGHADFVSWFVPAAEIITFIFLLFPKTAKIGLYSFIMLMSLFTIYIICAFIWEKQLPCHCGGIIEKLSWKQHLWFNLAFILLAIIAIRLIDHKQYFKNQEK